MITKYVKTLRLNSEDKEKAIVNLKKTCENCLLCDLSQTRDTVVFGAGNTNAKIMIIGEEPETEEDVSGLPYTSRSGKLLKQIIEKAGLNSKDLYYTYVIKCKITKNREANEKEIKLCEDYLLAQIAIVNPQVIVLCGKIPCQIFFDKKFLNENEYFDIRGNFYKSQGIIFVPIFSLPYILTQPSDENGMPRQLTLNDFINIKNYVEKV